MYVFSIINLDMLSDIVRYEKKNSVRKFKLKLYVFI